MYRGKRERPLPVLVRGKLGEWLAGEQFAGAYGVRGKPGWPPSRPALVTIFQLVENLTNRQAVEAVRTRIDWKYALGLDLAAGSWSGRWPRTGGGTCTHRSTPPSYRCGTRPGGRGGPTRSC